MIFDSSRFGDESKEIQLGNDILEVVNSYKYLGHIVQRNLVDIQDVEGNLNNFYAKFNTTFRKFKNVSVETFIFLFNSFCSPEYGIALWDANDVYNRHIFHAYQIAYNNALKRIVGVPKMYSSHDIADYCDMYLLEHYIILVQSRYYKRILKSNNPLVKRLKPYLIGGRQLSSLISTMNDKYSINFMTNDLDVIRARLTWTQKNEIRTGIRFHN